MVSVGFTDSTPTHVTRNHESEEELRIHQHEGEDRTMCKLVIVGPIYPTILSYVYDFSFFIRAWLFLWLAHNIGLSLLNKLAFSKVDFPYPFVLLAIHMWCHWMGSSFDFPLARPTWVSQRITAAWRVIIIVHA
jgi:hypothetical protein